MQAGHVSQLCDRGTFSHVFKLATCIKDIPPMVNFFREQRSKSLRDYCSMQYIKPTFFQSCCDVSGSTCSLNTCIFEFVVCSKSDRTDVIASDNIEPLPAGTTMQSPTDRSLLHTHSRITSYDLRYGSIAARRTIT